MRFTQSEIEKLKSIKTPPCLLSEGTEDEKDLLDLLIRAKDEGLPMEWRNEDGWKATNMASRGSCVVIRLSPDYQLPERHPDIIIDVMQAFASTDNLFGFQYCSRWYSLGDAPNLEPKPGYVLCGYLYGDEWIVSRQPVYICGQPTQIKYTWKGK